MTVEDPLKGGGKKIITPVNRIKFPLILLVFFLSLPILATIIWLFYVREYDCEYLLKLRKLQYGIVIGLIIIFLLSNCALSLIMKSRFPMPGIFVIIIPLVVMLLVGLSLVGAFKMESQSIPGSPEWLEDKIILDNSHWDRIKSCIFDKKECESFASRSYLMKPYDFTSSKLSPIESGCCRPPVSCDMAYVNATYWKKDGGEDSNSNPYGSDCNLWTNDATILCYNCHACKEGFERTIQKKWTNLGTFLVTMAIILVIVHLLIFVVSMWERYGG